MHQFGTMDIIRALPSDRSSLERRFILKTLLHNGHRIDIKTWGTEKVFYDGRQMTSKFTLLGGTHAFEIEENGERVTYEVEISAMGWSPCVKIRRNGILIYSDK